MTDPMTGSMTGPMTGPMAGPVAGPGASASPAYPLPDPGEAARTLRDGGVALVPTDTVYGLAASPERPDAVARIFELKDRPLTRQLPVMVAGLDDLAAIGLDVTEPARKLLASDLMPGPLTLALGFRAGLAPGEKPGWLEGRDEVAIRVPNHPWMREVLALTGPLLVTSANAHQQASGETVDAVLAQLHGTPEVVVDGGALSVVPSTLVNCRAVPPKIEREGAVPAARIEEVLV
jgi:L-threonylcarbamoyladenylate synthase